MSATTMSIKQRTKWLDNFNEGHQAVRLALGVIESQVITLREAGLDGVADRLTIPLTFVHEGVTVMDNAVSQMIHEQAQESWNQIGETFKALLGSINQQPHNRES